MFRLVKLTNNSSSFNKPLVRLEAENIFIFLQ